jgi:hypothetical protein
VIWCAAKTLRYFYAAHILSRLQEKCSSSFTADLLTRDDTGLDAEKEETIKIAASALYSGQSSGDISKITEH